MNLYPYQEAGVRWLLEHPRRYLGDRMGLGKTVQAAVAARRLQERLGRSLRALIISRAAAIENWRREWKTWGPHGASVGAVLSYADRRLHSGLARGRDWDLVILDEAHAVKNREAQRTIAALDVARGAASAWLLSGSPSPNYDPYELWAPVCALWPEIPKRLDIRTHEEWRDYFCDWRWTRYGKKTVGTKNMPVMRLVLDKIMLRRRVEDVFGDLPSVRVDVHLLPRDPALNGIIGHLRTKDGSEEWGPVFRRLTGEFKAPRVADVIEQELKDREYDKIVLMAYHRNVLDSLHKRLAPYGVARLDGSTRNRQAVVDLFTNGAGMRVFLGQQGAAGEAINLQVASEVALVEPSHNPEDNAQALARIRPHLQGNRVRARLFAVADSPDQEVMDNIAAKLRNRKELGL